MVTGVETAGLVLAVVPLVIWALEKWHGGFNKTRSIVGFRKKDRQRLATRVLGLVAQLRWHDTQLKINLKCLLLAADSNLELEELPRDFKNQLWTGSLGDSVDKYLRHVSGDDGDEAVSAFKAIMDASKELLEDIAESFQADGRDMQGNLRSLKDLCDFLKGREGKMPFTRRFGFTFKEEEIDRLTKGFGTNASSIGQFVADAARLDMLVLKSTSEKSSKRLKKVANHLYSTRRQAFGLFNALKGGWMPNCAHVEHSTVLHLQPDPERKDKLLSTDQEFHVLFRWLAQADAEACWKESDVVMSSAALDPPGPGGGPKIQFAVESANKAVYDEVTDICQRIALAHANSQDIQFHVSEGSRLYCVTGDAGSLEAQQKRKRILPTGPRLISLDSHLTSKSRKILDRKRIELAIKLACAILQYNETPWFGRGWRKEHLYFFRDPMTAASIDIDHPLVLGEFPQVAATPAALHTEPKETLLDFSILLMELYHGMTFEDWMKAQHPKVDRTLLQDEADQRRLYAGKWFDNFPRNEGFRSIVGICLWPHQLEQCRDSSWEDEDFRCAFYEHVIAPLLEL